MCRIAAHGARKCIVASSFLLWYNNLDIISLKEDLYVR